LVSVVSRERRGQRELSSISTGFFNFHIWNKSKVKAGNERLGETIVAKVGASLWMSVTHEPLV